MHPDVGATVSPSASALDRHLEQYMAVERTRSLIYFCVVVTLTQTMGWVTNK